ncbi:MAG: DNA repair protein RadC [Chitinophagales bacterium]
MAEYSDRYTLKQWAEDDRPREKMLHNGRHALSNAELLAIILGSGNKKETAVELAQRILLDCRNNLDILGKRSIHELTHFPGIGPAKAVGLVACFELGRRHRQAEAIQRTQIRSSTDIFEWMYPSLGDLPHEEFWVLYLNKANRVLEREKISAGGLTGTVVDLRIILRNALQKLACGLVLVHNHPSGNLQPSDADISLTKKVRDAATLLDITVLDHIIIGEKNYYSFADNGLL